MTLLGVDWSRLVSERRRFGANKFPVDLPSIPIDSSDAQDTLPPKVKINYLVDLWEPNPLPGGLFMHKSRAGTLHIPDYDVVQADVEVDPKKGPKFHITDCRTIEESKLEYRYDRFVFSVPTHGRFKIHPFTDESKTERSDIEIRLLPCKNCFEELEYIPPHGPRRNQIVESFRIDDFLKEHSPHFRCLPTHTSNTMPPGKYPQNWLNNSTKVRERNGWKCTDCAVDCQEDKNLLHAHHIDGNRGNVKRSNLTALCVLCHKRIHDHLDVEEEEVGRIYRLRSEQGLRVYEPKYNRKS